jgi:hypothetical protein
MPIVANCFKEHSEWLMSEMTRGRSLSAVVKRSGRLMLLLVVLGGIFSTSENPRKSAITNRQKVYQQHSISSQRKMKSIKEQNLAHIYSRAYSHSDER